MKPAVTEGVPETELSQSASQQPQKIDDQKFRDGILALQSSDLTTAKQLFLDFIRSNPELAGAYTNLALIHFKQGEYEQSLQVVTMALQLNDRQAEAYHLRAQIEIVNGNIHDAKKDYLKAIEIKPDYINAHYNLALLYDIYFQEIAQAIKHYEIYMSLSGKSDEATQEWINHLKGTLKNG